MVAAPVSQQRALQVAQQFIPVPNGQAHAPGMRVEEQPANVVYTHLMPKSGRPAFYVVNVGGSFVIVSADDVAHQVLGYNLGKNWPVSEQLPPQVKGFFDDLAAQMEAAIEANPNHASDAEWSQPQSAPQRRMMSELPDSVGPLLTTTWDQGQYYNALCPEDQNSPYDGHCLTGCVATAMAQIINYWGYPIHGRGIHSYETNYGTLTVNYDSAHYDFAHMPTQLTNTSTPQEIQAVATLMRDCGVATNMGYRFGESSAYDFDARAGLINYFRFSPNLSFAEKDFFTESEWNAMLREDLSANRPVLYSGHGIGDHTFVCDGYKQDGFYHFNFGWSGYCDAWYQLSAVNPAQYDFSSSQTALLGIIPDSTAKVILGQMTGTSTYEVENALEFYHIFGHNRLPINPNSVVSAQYQNDVVFSLQDTSARLSVELLNYSDQTLHVANGDCTDNLVFLNQTICTFAPGYISYTSPLTSTSNAIACRYIGGPNPDGFCIRVSELDSCRMVSNIISMPDTNRVQLSWTENGNADQWNIEYGTKGFARGTGTLITVDTTVITIEDLNAYVDYDFYIRPRCHEAWYGPYSEKTDLSYWQDYVNEQPEGIIYNSEGFAIVSTPEQLAWLLRDNGTTEKIIITADLDLGGHRWKPVDNSSIKKIYGDGHSISNLLIREAKSSLKNHVGLIGALSGSSMDTVVIRDLTFVNPIIIGERIVSDCGVLFGYLMNGYITPTVLNCGVNGGQIDCSASFVGGLVGRLECDILNSYANISVKNSFITPHTGGLVGQMDDGRIENCYTSSEIVYTPFDCSKGQVIGAVERGRLKNVYGKTSQYPFSPQINLGSVTDTASFGNDYILSTGIVFEDSLYYDLCNVLNERVKSQNENDWRLWKNDGNLDYPVFGDSYPVTCNNVGGLTANNVIHEGLYTLRLDWDSNSASSYIVKCVNKTDSTESARMYNVVDTPCFIAGLQLGDKYEIFVKCNCDSSQSGWGNPVSIIFDKPYWTDIVTAKPTGYEEDTEGNVTISSEEALTWFASRVNGLNGNNAYDFMGKTVSLIADVDLAQYKWMPIGNTWNNDFKGLFKGNGHTINNVYINENEDYVGFFGKLFQAKVMDVTLNNCMVTGNNYVGGLCGFYINDEGWWNYFNYGNVIFENCNVLESYVYGKDAVGGLYGMADISVSGVIFRNCSSSGSVFGGSNFGGLIGRVIQYGTKHIINCFSTTSVTCNHENGHGCQYYGGLIGYAYNATINNCYTAGVVDTISIGNYMGSMIGVVHNSHINYLYGLRDTIHEPGVLSGSYTVQNSTEFTKSDNLCVLQEQISVGDSTYSDLLSVLNAWVDANNQDSIYCHWVADTAMVNGGFPIFAPLPTYVVTFQNADGTILQMDTLQYGSFPVYRGEEPAKARSTQFSYTFSGWSPKLTVVSEDALYTAAFDSIVNKYVIIFRNADSTLLQIDSVEYGTWPEYRGVIPSKENTAQYTYSFAGWSPDMAEVTGDAIYTATFTSTINQYAIAFLNYDGTELQRSSLNYGVSPIYEGPTPTKPATAQNTYTFKGWDKEILPVVGAETYIAQFDSVVNKYIISFIDEDSTWLQADSVEYGLIPAYTGATPAKLPTAQYTYIFSGWNPVITEVTGPTTYIATYDSVFNKYVVMFLNDDSTLLQIDTLNYGDMPAYRGATPAKQATAQYTYMFNGWNNAIEFVTGNAIYLATYVSTTNKYLITFQDENGAMLQQDSVEYGAFPAYHGTTPTKAATAQYTYTFAGWNPSVTSVIGDVTYTATYSSIINQYSIAFLNYDGVELQRSSINYGVTPAYNGPTPTKLTTAQYTYTFKGWDKEILPVAAAETYVAQFDSVVNKYLITFKDEDGTTLQQDSVEYGLLPAYRGETPTKPSTAEHTYFFGGWAPTVVQVTENATYTATYTETVNKYVVLFQDEDGTILQRDTLDYGTTPIYRGEDPTKESTAEATFTFVGWTPSITAVVEDVVYTATYNSVVNTYVVMFLNEDSTLLQIDTLEYGAMPEYRGEDPVKPNEGDYFYVFTGWEPEVVAVVGDAVYIATYESHGTGFDNVAEKQKPVKVMEDGKMYILLPDGTKYSATGKKVE